MRRLFLCISLPVSVCAAQAPPVGPADGPRFAPDVFGGYSSAQIIVQLTRKAWLPVAQARNQGRLAINDDHRPFVSQPMRQLAAQWRVARMRPLYDEEFRRPDLAARYGLDRTFILEVPQGTDTPTMARGFSALREDVELASLDLIGGVAGAFIPNDTSFLAQWGMNNTGQTAGTADADIDAPEAWDIHTGDAGTVTIAIIDSGVTAHAEYSSRMVPGRNTADPLFPNLTVDECVHGTHVAGIAAAQGDNGAGVAGVTWGANIMPIRVTNASCGGLASWLINGIIWATDHGANIGNMSLQYYRTHFPTEDDEKTLQNAINYAHDQGMLLIAANGNNDGGGGGFIAFPARLNNTLAVGATTDDDLIATTSTTSCRCWRSNYGPEVDLAAPGDRILSTWPENGRLCNNAAISGYNCLDGTSMATPHVSGLAALIKSYMPDLTNVEIGDILTTTVDDLGPPGWDWNRVTGGGFGYGRINAERALLAAAVWPTILSSHPANHAIDARQPTDSNGFGDFGFELIEMEFPPEVAKGIAFTDFTLSRKCRAADCPDPPPAIEDVFVVGETTVHVVLTSPIDVFAWTTVAHGYTGIVRMGFLPGDVDESGKTDTDDALALIEALGSLTTAGAILPPEWSIDLDRSAVFSPLDLWTCMNLLNGADSFPVYLNQSLP